MFADMNHVLEHGEGEKWSGVAMCVREWNGMFGCLNKNAQ